MSASRDLLFGLLALQNGIINQVQLAAAFQAWTLDKSSSLADHLEARGDLTGGKRVLLEALAEAHGEAHGGDIEKSLAAISAGKSTRESLARLDDPDIAATLGHVGSGHGSTEGGDADRTTTYAVGMATSDGQRFRVLRPHARGGLGAVFVALDGELNREVALKQILDHRADDSTSRQRFLIEAEVTGGLEHPGIVPVYGLGSYADGRPYYAMRFIRGDSLKEAIDRFHGADLLPTGEGGPQGRMRVGEAVEGKRGPHPSRLRRSTFSPREKGSGASRSLEIRKLLRRFMDVCNAIDYAHSRGVLHRDIKPGNIIVGKHGETLVVDWGLAKATGKSEPGAEERTLIPSSASGSAETLPGSALGTPAYMTTLQGHVLLNEDKLDEAALQFQRALDEYRRLRRDAFYWMEHSWCLGGMGWVKFRRGDVGGAVALYREAFDEMAHVPSSFFQNDIQLAELHARMSEIARDVRSGLPPDAAAAEADLALGFLRKAVATGYRDVVGLRTENALAAIRDRPEFHMIALDAAFPDDPFEE